MSRRKLAGFNSVVKNRGSFANQLLKENIKEREKIDLLY